MNKEQLASLLNGRAYRNEITDDEHMDARKTGLLVLFGHSDDNVEIRGAAYDEVGAYNGKTILLHREEPIVLPPHDKECECRFCTYTKAAERCAEVTAHWDRGNGYSWEFETEIPHAEFDIMDGADKFCRGIVIDVKDLPSIA